MKTDRKLLEAAAKAAGYECAWSDSREGFYFGLGSYTPQYWNPLSNDGDALRLAVKLGLCVTSFINSEAWAHDPSPPFTMVGFKTSANSGSNIEELHGDDPVAATRRAIVRAAAAMAG